MGRSGDKRHYIVPKAYGAVAKVNEKFTEATAPFNI